MSARNIGYWATTGLLAFALAGGGVVDLTRNPEVVATLGRLGYAPYVASLLGVWKLLGAVALLAPRFPRLKEWAYAGIVFELSGAMISHLASGDGGGEITVPFVLLALAVASWSLRPESRRLRQQVPFAAHHDARAAGEADAREHLREPRSLGA